MDLFSSLMIYVFYSLIHSYLAYVNYQNLMMCRYCFSIVVLLLLIFIRLLFYFYEYSPEIKHYKDCLKLKHPGHHYRLGAYIRHFAGQNIIFCINVNIANNIHVSSCKSSFDKYSGFFILSFIHIHLCDGHLY